jgi:hypothetical protein
MIEWRAPRGVLGRPKKSPSALIRLGFFVSVVPVLHSGAETWRFEFHRSGKRGKVTIGAQPAIGDMQFEVARVQRCRTPLP